MHAIKGKGEVFNMQPIEKIETPAVSIPHAGISQAVRYGSFLFVSGQVGEDLTGNVPDGIEAQVDQAIRNASCILQAAGSDLSNVLMCRCFLRRQEDFEGMNRAYFRHFENCGIGPARYTIIAPLCGDQYLFEIAMFAAV